MLEALDQGSRRWTCSQILPRPDWPTTGVIVRADVPFLERRGAPRRAPVTARFSGYVFDNLGLPPNAGSEERLESGHFSSRTSRHDRADFTAAGIRCEVLQEDGYTEIYAAARQAEFPAHFDERLRSTLEFVSGKPVPWAAFQHTTSDAVWLHVRGRAYTPMQGRIQRPIRTDLSDSVEATYRLFDCHLQHVLGAGEPPMHRLGAEWGEVLRGSVGTLETQATITCVVVESLCRYLQQNGLVRIRRRAGGAGWPRYKRALGRWRNAVLRASAGLELSPGLRRRIVQAFSAVGFVSASRVLKRLVAEGALDPHLMTVWERLRPAAAHADREALAQGGLEQLNADCRAVVTLLYQLMFHAIGYEGTFTDFSARGWPPAVYPPRRRAAASPEG